MASKLSTVIISINRVFLYEKNPRHDEVANQSEAISALCAREHIELLAQDIVKVGVNPLETLAVFPVNPDAPPSSRPKYFAAEGNRRLCALKLLNDPELAPPKLKRTFRALAAKWKTPVKTVEAIVFSDFDATRVWLDRIHSDIKGVTRRKWNSEQKSRFDTNNKNRAAQDLLDYLEEEGLISKDERQGKLTTVDRFISNPKFREFIGLDRKGGLSRTRPEAAFRGLIDKFAKDLIAGEAVNSRMNKEHIEKYADELIGSKNPGNDRIEATPLVNPTEKKSDKKSTGDSHRKTKPKVTKKATNIIHYKEIEDALVILKNEKLSSLYYSICSVGLEHHSPLIAVGIWSFLETLTACAGRTKGVDFLAFLNKAKLTSYGFSEDNNKAMRSAIERFSDVGNTTKHHTVSAAFNGDQMNNDMATIKLLILKCVEESSTKA